MNTIVLNADYTYLNIIPWQKAIKLLIKDKAEVIKETNTQVKNCDNKYSFSIPLVLKLVKMVQIVYKNKVPFSRKNIFVRDQYTCQYCGAKENLNIDHIVPSSKGGKTCFENCMTSCVECNTKKGNRTPEEAQMTLKRKPYEPTIIEFLTYKMKHTGVYEFLKDIKIY